MSCAAVASVSLSFVDLEGNPVSPTEATYRVDGGEELPVECTNEDCTEAVAGWEQAGTFEITVVYHEPVEGEPDCWYTDQVTETVEVAQGECHVEGVQLTIELDTTFVDCLMGTQTGT